MDAALLRRFLSETEILRAPRRSLSTFGATDIRYHLISSIDDLRHRTRLREGRVVSMRPKIITPEAFAERFQGFGPEGAELTRWLTDQYRDLLRVLEYNFANQGFDTRVISDAPRAVADRISADIDRREARDSALILCPDSGWSLALMKFTLDEAARSFPTHVRDLERRGLFRPPPL